MRLRYGGIFNYFVTRNLLLSLVVKNGQHLATLEAKIEWFHFFLDTVYTVTSMMQISVDGNGANNNYIFHTQ